MMYDSRYPLEALRCDQCEILASPGIRVGYSTAVSDAMWRAVSYARTRPFSRRSSFVLPGRAAAIILPNLPPRARVSEHDPRPYLPVDGVPWCMHSRRDWPVIRSAGWGLHLITRLTDALGVFDARYAPRHAPWSCLLCEQAVATTYSQYLHHVRWHIKKLVETRPHAHGLG